jgi:hypothetical protein
MSTNYAGRPGNESLASNQIVIDATNATPIVVQTSAPHGLQEGERVYVYGVVGNAAANAIAYVHVTDIDKFALYQAWSGGAVALPIAGSGAYVSGGVAQPLAWASTLQLPSDGDAINAASVNTATEGEGDREAWLIERTGAYRLVNAATFAVDPGGPGVSTCAAMAASSGAWGDAGALNAAIDALYPLGVDVLPGDLIEVTATCSVSGAGAVVIQIALRIGLEFAEYGSAFTGTTTQAIASSSATLSAPATPGGYLPVSMVGSANPSASHGGTVIPRLQDYGIFGSPGYQLWGVCAFRVRVWRAN